MFVRQSVVAGQHGEGGGQARGLIVRSADKVEVVIVPGPHHLVSLDDILHHLVPALVTDRHNDLIIIQDCNIFKPNSRHLHNIHGRKIDLLVHVPVEAVIVDELLNALSVGNLLIQISVLKNWSIWLVAWQIQG